MTIDTDSKPYAFFADSEKHTIFYIFLFFLTACYFFSPPAQSQTTTPIIIGTVSGQLDNTDSFFPFSDYLESRLPDHQFEVKGFATIEALTLAVENQAVNFAFITPVTLVQLNIESSYRTLATITQPAGESFSPWLAGAVFTRAANPDINSLSDVSDKKVVALSRHALGGWLSAVREWQDMGIDVDTDLAELNFVFSYSSVIERVCSGEADVGVLSANALLNNENTCNETLKVLPHPDASQSSHYQLRHSTRLYPEVAFVMLSDYDEAFIRNFTQAILDIEPDSTVASAVNISGFTAPLPYTEVQALMQELRLGPYSNPGALTLRRYLKNNIIPITLLLLAVIALITGGLINARRLGKKYQQSEQFRKQVFEGSHIPMVVVDYKNMTFVDMNFAAVSQYGYQSKQQLIGQTLQSISATVQLNDRSIKEALEQIITTVTLDGKATFEWIHIRPDGKQWLAKIHLMAFDSVEEKVIQATIEDITEHKQREDERLQLEHQLEFSQRMESIGRLAGGIAHDFNNLLTVINGYCEILLENNKKNPSLTNILQQISKAGNRAAELTKKLLTFSRRQSTHQIPVNIALIIEDSAEIMKSVLGEHIKLELELNEQPRQVLADPGQLQQVLLNLVVNAKDAMPDGGILKIKTQDCIISEHAAKILKINAGEYIEMTVSDNGIGIDQNIKQHIFEPFFTTKDTGTGLGLSTVYGIIQQSNGTIKVSSTEGKSTTFSVLLPQTKDKEKAVEINTTKVSPTQGSYSILLVEDQQDVMDYASSVLEKAGHRVLTAHSGTDALFLIEQQQEPVHLLLTDVVMDGINGVKLAELLSEKFPDIPVLFISGYPKDSLARYGIEENTSNFLAKPFSPDVLLDRINTIFKSNYPD